VNRPPPTGPDALAEAEQAERAGDLTTAARLLQSHLGGHGEDGPTRLRLGRLLYTLNEGVAARAILRPLEQLRDPELAARANRLLALLDEREGALSSAEIRWEKLLVDDIDDVEARARLRALRPEQARGPTDPSLATLAAPEGIRTARFRLIRELGRGSSATVYLVRDEQLDLPLALKVLHPQLASAPRAEARAAFFAEARLAAGLRHPGVVAIYDVDETTRALAMEYLAGGTLRDRLRVSGLAAGSGAPPPQHPIDARELLATATSLLAALAYVHGAGVIHGDLKPGNVLLRSPGEVVLADFGGARLLAAARGGLGGSRPEDALGPQGTPLYLAPEQFHGAPASAATDLFAAGVILWEVASGQPARRRHELLQSPELLPAHLPGEALDLAGPRGPRLRAVIEALAAPRAESRPPSAASALLALG
jgi:hypothetical protein